MQCKRILPPPGRTKSPGPQGGRYCPVKTAKILLLPSTTDTCVRPEESIGDMPLSPRGYSVDDNLDVDGHNEVGTKSRGCYHLLALSARSCHIIDSGRFLTGGPPTARIGDRGEVLLQDQSPSRALSPLQRMSP